MKKRKILFGLCAFSAVLGLAACKGDETEPDPIVQEEEFTITFNSNGGSTIASKKAKKDEKITNPGAPTREGYTFDGWFKDASCTLPWNFTTDVVTGNATLYAKWTKKDTPAPVEKYSVTYVINGHGTQPANLTDQTKLPDTLPVLSEEGWTFDGWYTDEALQNEAEAGAALTANATLYAKWTENPVEEKGFKVWFHLTATDEGTLVVADADGMVEAQDDPTMPYKTFDGWYTSATEQTEDTMFSFLMPVTEDTHVYAKWISQTETVNFPLAYADAIAIVGGEGSSHKSSGNITIGRFTFEDGQYFESSNGGCVNTQGKKIYFSLTGNGKITFDQKGASGNGNTIALYRVVDGGTDELVHTWDTVANSVQVNGQTWDLTPGSYYLASTNSGRLYNLVLTETLEKSAPKSIEISNQEIHYLQGRELNKNISVTLVYENGRKDSISLSDCTIDADAFKKDVPGTYTISVKHNTLEFEASYDVYVYSVESIELYDYVLSAGRVTLPLQKVFLTDSKFNYDNLAVHAIAKTPDLEETMDFVLNASEYSVVNGTLAKGTVHVTVSEKISASDAKTAGYDIVVVDNVFDENATEYVVTVDASADVSVTSEGVVFNTINDALKYLEIVEAKEALPKVVNIAAGTYNEKVSVTMKNVRFVGTGDSRDDVVIVFNALSGLTDPSGTIDYSTNGSATVTITASAVGFSAEKVTFKNYYNTNALYEESKLVAGSGTQAVAALVQADQSKFVDCVFTSYHDTLYAQLGRQYYENCFIEGRTDYIFGFNATAYFKNCDVHTIGAGVTVKNGGYVVSTKGLSSGATTDAIKYGYIFDGCTFDADDNTMDGSVSIARGWDVKMAVMVMNSNISKAYSKAAYGADNGGVNARYGKMNAAPVAELLLEYNNEGDGAIQASLANSCTVLTSAEAAADYADFAKIFGTTNGLVTYSVAWNPVAVKDATVVLKDQDGNVLATLSNVAYAGAAIAKDDVVPFVNIPDGSIIEGFYSNQSCTTAYDFTTALVSGENSIYVKFTTTATLSNMTIKFEDLPSSIENEYTIEGTVVTLVGSTSKKISVDTSGKAIKDADGNDYTAAQRVKTGGATDSTGRYIKIDLTAYEGQAKIQIYTQTGTSAESRTGQLRKDSVTGTSLKVIDCPSGGAATLNEAVVDCGSVYYITADASINFYGINILPQTSSQPKPPAGDDDKVAHTSEFSWAAISTSLLNPVGTYSYDENGTAITPVDKYDGAKLTNAVFAGTANAFINIIDTATVTYRDGVKYWDAAKEKASTNPQVMEIKGEALTVTFTGTGTLTIGAASTGGSNDSSIGVKNATGATVEAATASTDGYYVVHGTSATTLTFNITAPGTYTIWTNTEAYNRATRISSLVVVDNYAEAK